MLVPSEKFRFLISSESDFSFDKYPNENKVAATYENKRKSSAVSPLAIIHRNPRVIFRLSNCLCIGEINGRCMDGIEVSWGKWCFGSRYYLVFVVAVWCFSPIELVGPFFDASPSFYLFLLIVKPTCTDRIFDSDPDCLRVRLPHLFFSVFIWTGPSPHKKISMFPPTCYVCNQNPWYQLRIVPIAGSKTRSGVRARLRCYCVYFWEITIQARNDEERGRGPWLYCLRGHGRAPLEFQSWRDP